MTASVNRIAEMRKHAGLTQQALADKLGIHWVTVSKIERGSIKLTLERCKEIAGALSVSEASLLFDQEEPVEIDPVGWYRDPVFSFHLSLGKERPDNSTSDPDEWLPIAAPKTRKERKE